MKKTTLLKKKQKQMTKKKVKKKENGTKNKKQIRSIFLLCIFLAIYFVPVRKKIFLAISTFS